MWPFPYSRQGGQQSVGGYERVTSNESPGLSRGPWTDETAHAEGGSRLGGIPMDVKECVEGVMATESC